MEYSNYESFKAWASANHWFEVMFSSDDESNLSNHYFLTPAGTLVQVIEGEGEVISLIYQNRVD